MSWEWIYGFSGAVGTLWVLASAVLSAMGHIGKDVTADGLDAHVDGLDASADGGFDAHVDGLDVSADGGFDAHVDGLDVSADGGFDAHVDGLDASVDGLDAHADAIVATEAQELGHDQAGFPFLSPYVIASFLAGFGIIGYGALGLGWPLLFHLPLAGVSGMVMGGSLGGFLWKMRTTWSTSEEAKVRYLVGKPAEVCISIPEGGTGEVVLVAGGTRQTFAARNADGRALPAGSTVRIQKFDGTTVLVRQDAAERIKQLAEKSE